MCLSFSHTKNILRIYEADICQKVKNTEAQTKWHILIKRKACNLTRNILLCIHFFYKQPVYKQPGVSCPKFKQLFGLRYLTVSNFDKQLYPEMLKIKQLSGLCLFKSYIIEGNSLFPNRRNRYCPQLKRFMRSFFLVTILLSCEVFAKPSYTTVWQIWALKSPKN